MAVNNIFFSYSFKDEEKVLKVREIIESIVDEEGNQKYSVFMASDPINGNKSGRSWNSQEKRQMLNSFLVLFFLSDNSIISDGASQELEFYFNTMRKRGKEKFLYISLNGKSMTDSVLDMIKNDESYVSDILVETIVSRYELLIDEPDFRDNHLYITYDDVFFKSRLETSILEMFNAYNGTSNKEDKYKKVIEKLENIKNNPIENKEEQKEIKKEEKQKKKIEKKKNVKIVDSALADIFKQQEEPEDVIFNKKAILDCLSTYRIDGEIVNYYVGPSITLYEVKLEKNAKLSKFLLIKDDLSLQTGEKIRIIAPIPGKNLCGIEIPNKQRKLLKFGELLTDDFLKKGNSFTCVMGKNSYNEIKEYDVSKMPHCLISGTVGSGAVNILNTIIVSLLMKYSPYELRLVLADPHRVEFSSYKNIPHLLYPLIEEASAGTPVFKEIYEEIEKRYRMLQENGCLNIYQYNEDRVDKMPYILIVINEYSDFVMFDKEIEKYIMKIVQKGRAVGVHFVLYTQRPSIDILTGVLKANFSTRITGVVNSYIDSRTIIEEGGAELLIGKGDALVKFQGISERIQAAFISEKELSSFCSAIINKYGATVRKDIPKKEEKINEVKEDIDPILIDVIEFLYKDKKVTISKLQATFSIGFARGVRILEKLLELGIVERDGAIATPIVSIDKAYQILIKELKGATIE